MWKVGKGAHLHRLRAATGHRGARCGFAWREPSWLPLIAGWCPKAGWFGLGAPQWPQGRGQRAVAWSSSLQLAQRAFRSRSRSSARRLSRSVFQSNMSAIRVRLRLRRLDRLSSSIVVMRG